VWDCNSVPMAIFLFEVPTNRLLKLDNVILVWLKMKQNPIKGKSKFSKTKSRILKK